MLSLGVIEMYVCFCVHLRWGGWWGVGVEGEKRWRETMFVWMLIKCAHFRLFESEIDGLMRLEKPRVYICKCLSDT